MAALTAYFTHPNTASSTAYNSINQITRPERSERSDRRAKRSLSLCLLRVTFCDRGSTSHARKVYIARENVDRIYRNTILS